MLAMFLLMVTISGYAVDEFNVSTSTAGLVAGIFIVGSLIGRILTGHQLSLIGAKRIMYIGTGMFIVTYGLYFVAGNLPMLLLVRFFQWTGQRSCNHCGRHHRSACITKVTSWRRHQLFQPEL
ncbi:MFS transporter, partial [Salinicoccus sesuvii]